jgi:hypothetical protein
VKALTLWQPWATLVALGEKKIETRSWSTDYRGPLAIHASLSHAGDNLILANVEPFCAALARHGIVSRLQLPLGAIVAVCELEDVHEIDHAFAGSFSVQEIAFGDWSPGRLAWVLKNVSRFASPILARGRQGLWEWEAQVA